MTSVYFVRHAQPDFSWNDTKTRPLTDEGKADTEYVVKYLMDAYISAVYSSPFRRTIDTVKGLADMLGLDIVTIDALHERTIGKRTESDFLDYARHQWDDHTYKAQGGESLSEVRERNINVLEPLISRHENENIVIATHGTSLSTILNYYDSSYGYDDFMGIINLMPYIVRVDFESGKYLGRTDIFSCKKVYNG